MPAKRKTPPTSPAKTVPRTSELPPLEAAQDDVPTAQVDIEALAETVMNNFKNKQGGSITKEKILAKVTETLCRHDYSTIAKLLRHFQSIQSEETGMGNRNTFRPKVIDAVKVVYDKALEEVLP